MVLAVEFSGPPFHFSMNASANIAVFVAKLDVTPNLGLQRHWASKGALKASQGVPKAPTSSQNDTTIVPKCPLNDPIVIPKWC